MQEQATVHVIENDWKKPASVGNFFVESVADYLKEDSFPTLKNYNALYGIPKWDDVKDYCNSDTELATWLISEYPGVLKIPTECPKCNTPLGKMDSQCRIRCCNRQCRRDNEPWHQSVWTGSFFDGCRNGKTKIMEFLYLWLIGSGSQVIGTHLGWSTNKVQRWEQAVRDLVATVVRYDHEMIGGPGVVVEIDESKFGKRKYNRGHRVEGSWVFGGVELTPDWRFFAVIVPDRKASTLVPIIKAHIAPGSIIRSDFWKAYDVLPFQEGYDYVHEKVNHSETYVDPENATHTNNIEGTWNGVKRKVPVQKRTKGKLQSCLFEFIWRRRNQSNLWNGLMRALQDVQYD